MFDSRKKLVPVLFVFVGVFADFVTGGVFKIIWIAIYGTAYVALAITLETYLLRLSYFNPIARMCTLWFLVGTVLSHLFLVDHHHRQIYPMSIVTITPIALTSKDFVELLYLKSEKLSEHLVKDAPKNVQVDTEAISNYACVQSLRVVSVDQIDFNSDPLSSWTWRLNRLGIRADFDAPNAEKSLLPWCWYEFYRHK